MAVDSIKQLLWVLIKILTKMNKNILLYLGGLVSGIFLTLAFGFFLTFIHRGELPSPFANKTLFEKEGDCVPGEVFEVYEVLPSGDAVAEAQYSLLKVLINNPDGKPYYDHQIIEIPDGKSARQIGIYKYHFETIPIVEIR